MIRRTPLKRFSKKRAKDMKVYKCKRDEYMEAHPVCEICLEHASEDCHHRKKRGKYYLDEGTYLAVCRTCHNRVHAFPAWARENGYLK